MSRSKFTLTREQRQFLADKLQIRGFSLPRVAGRAMGALLRGLDVSELDRDDPLAEAFADGVAEGKLARGLGDLLTARTHPKREDDST